MGYVPKNRIVTDLNTRGGEYRIIETQQEYAGFYYMLYNGEIYTGKNPNDSPNQKLEKIIPSEDRYDNVEGGNQVSEIAYPYDAPYVGDGTLPENEKTLNEYLQLRGLEINNLPVKQIPPTYYPNPTDKEYQNGEFQRYFIKKVNEFQYTEINKENYEKMVNEDDDYLWQMYNSYYLTWQISGDRQKVRKTNRNVVDLMEQKYKMLGFSKYLKNNYLKYYKYTPQNNLYTYGNELVTMDGKDYVGYYHINKSIGPMIGKYHTPTPHNRLLWKYDFKPKPKQKTKDIKPFQSRRSGGSSSY